jgi:hypothetical protein
MMTLAIAEVVGIVYYRALARGLDSPALALSLERIANEEALHLDFQAAYFERVVAVTAWPLRAAHRLLLRALMLAILSLAVAVLWADHGALLRRAGVRLAQVIGRSWHELRSREFLASARMLPAVVCQTHPPLPSRVYP